MILHFILLLSTNYIIMHFLHWIFFLNMWGFLPRRIAVVCNVDLFFRDLIGLWGRKHHTSLLKEHFAVIFPFRHYNILLWNHSGFLDFIHRRHTTKFSGLKKLDEKNGGGGLNKIYYKKGDFRYKDKIVVYFFDHKIRSLSRQNSFFNEVNS